MNTEPSRPCSACAALPADAVINPGDWREGLVLGIKTLNVETVSRAKGDFREVLPVCLAHNLRQQNDKHRHKSKIDPNRTPNNEVLVGPGDLNECVRRVAEEFDRLGIQPRRRDAIAGIELVIQPPSGWDAPDFWRTALEWVRSRYEHVVSAVIHRDQERPHVHVLVLAVSGGKLAGSAMTSQENRFEKQRSEFQAVMRDKMGIRSDRPNKPPRDFAAIMTSTGKGERNRGRAARSDRALESRGRRRAEAAWQESLAQKSLAPNSLAQPKSATSYCAALERVLLLHQLGVAMGVFAVGGRAITTLPPSPSANDETPERRQWQDRGCEPAGRCEATTLGLPTAAAARTPIVGQAATSLEQTTARGICLIDTAGVPAIRERDKYRLAAAWPAESSELIDLQRQPARRGQAAEGAAVDRAPSARVTKPDGAVKSDQLLRSSAR